MKVYSVAVRYSDGTNNTVIVSAGDIAGAITKVIGGLPTSDTVIVQFVASEMAGTTVM